MKTITKFILSFSVCAGLNVLGKVLFDIEPLSTEVAVELSFIFIYCMNEDAKK